ncbi:MAG TPA: MBL fold metallo-hydrolase [Phycisphaerae bacterium]|nr:MBL fold metallo-hydrolase [Phycisphaerae bacterium]
MSLELCVLGSGSGGNSTVLRAPWGTFLIDAGFGPRTTAQRMCGGDEHSGNGGLGVDLPDISAIVLTHLDHDHFNKNWLQTIIKRGIRVFCARKRVKEILDSPEGRDAEAKRIAKRLGNTPLPQLVHGFDGEFQPVRGVTLQPMELAHDEEGSHGFLISCDGYRAGFATDLGHVPDVLIERFCGVDLLAMESNYDPEMERTSDRPWYLKQRVMGGRGHLSNEQALAAIQAILDRTQATCGPDRLPRHIVLLHRSRQCNCPELVRKLFVRDARIAPVLTLTHQDKRTPWLSVRRPQAQPTPQLALAWA